MYFKLFSLGFYFNQMVRGMTLKSEGLLAFLLFSKASCSFGKNTCIDNCIIVLAEKAGERLMNDF